MNKKVIMITEVTAKWEKMAEFNQYWEKENLSYWEQSGARYIGSYTTYLGGDTNTTLRIFEFESPGVYHDFIGTRQAMFDSDLGRSAVETIATYVVKIRETAWISADGPTN